MSTRAVSRRGFFRNAVTATALGAAQAAPQFPAKAWTIVGINWGYNDEFCFEEGEFVVGKVYFDEAVAKAECQQMIDDFFADTPQEFEPMWDQYEVDPETATWDDLRKAGFPDPFYLMELQP
jgi:hypothetical protein